MDTICRVPINPPVHPISSLPLWNGWAKGTNIRKKDSFARKEGVEMFGWGMMIIGGLVMLLFWSIVIALAVWAICALTRSEQGRGEGKSLALHENNALEILKQRYAR